ncbi:MAG: hypothetical protein V4726_08940 [Verrucomicrobiota bacterium]
MNNPPADTDPSAAPPPADELISRHFDGALPPDEHQRLTELLHGHPQVLLDFVATARLHHRLEGLAPVRPAVRKKPFLRWIGIGTAAAAAVAAVTGGGWAVFRPSSTGENQARVTVTDLTPPPADAVRPSPVNLRKRTVKAAGATALTQQPDLEELLGRYYVNISPHGLTVPQALKQLEEAIRAVNLLNRPALNQLRFTVGESVEPGVEDPVVRTPLPAASMTVKAYLETCALFRQVTRQPGNVPVNGPQPASVRWKGVDPGSQSGTLQTRVYKVPADFLSSVPRKPESGGGTVGDPVRASPMDFPRLMTAFSSGGMVRDPFQAPPVESKPTAWQVVNEFFVTPQAEGSTVTFSAGTSRVVMRGSLISLDLFHERLESFTAHQKTDQIFLTGKICSMPRAVLPAGFDEMSGMILTDSEWQMYMRALSQTKGVDLFTTPSVIVRPGQRSKIEIIQEVAPAVPGAEAKNTGLTVEVEAQPCGEFIRLAGTVEVGLFGKEVVTGSPSQPLNMELREPEVSDGKPHYFPTEYEIWAPDRSTGMITLDVPLAQERNLVATMGLTATRIDPSGAPLDGQPGAISEEMQQEQGNGEVPVGIAITGRPGFVRSPWSTAGEVDVNGIPAGTKVLCPYTRKQFRVP